MISRILKNVKTVDEIQVSGKRVFLRVDFNCPLDEHGEVADNSRIESAIETIRYIIDQGGKVIIASHFGRPRGCYDPDLSLAPVARELSRLLNEDVRLCDPDLDIKKLEEYKTSEDKVIMLENIRFYPGEQSGDSGFAALLSHSADVYVNDAFGASHRKHASVYVLPGLFETRAMGFLVKTELTAFEKVLVNPERPFVVIMGGAKVSDKIKVLDNLLNVADDFLIGGAMSYTLMKAGGAETGSSLVEEDRVGVARDILRKSGEGHCRFMLPEDHCIVKSIDRPDERIYSRQINQGWMGVDIGPDTIKEYSRLIKKAKTIVWNGPMGIFEKEEYSTGTRKIAESLGCSDAFSVVGGGDSVRAVKMLDCADKVDLISTGGGASLKLLEGKGLPGINILM